MSKLKGIKNSYKKIPTFKGIGHYIGAGFQKTTSSPVTQLTAECAVVGGALGGPVGAAIGAGVGFVGGEFLMRTPVVKLVGRPLVRILTAPAKAVGAIKERVTGRAPTYTYDYKKGEHVLYQRKVKKFIDNVVSSVKDNVEKVLREIDTTLTEKELYEKRDQIVSKILTFNSGNTEVCLTKLTESDISDIFISNLKNLREDLKTSLSLEDGKNIIEAFEFFGFDKAKVESSLKGKSDNSQNTEVEQRQANSTQQGIHTSNQQNRGSGQTGNLVYGNSAQALNERGQGPLRI